MANGIDNLLVPSLRKQIESSLGKKRLEKIEKRLIDRHGMNMVQAIKDFYKLDSVLREFLGANADNIETKSLQNIIELEKSKRKEEWVTIQDQELSKMFLETLGDKDKNKILGTVMKKPLIIADILKKSRIPQTSGYRKIKSMISDGILIPNGFEYSTDGKKIKKYETVFQNIKMEIQENGMKVKIQLKKQILNNSTIFQIVQI